MRKYLNVDVYKEYYGDLDKEDEDSESSAIEDGTGGGFAAFINREQNTVAVEVTDRKAMETEENDEDDLGEELPESPEESAISTKDDDDDEDFLGEEDEIEEDED